MDKDLRVKVADFGLTRDIYETDYYRQHHRTMIPVKWMAPESLIDRISNEKTDVVRSQKFFRKASYIMVASRCSTWSRQTKKFHQGSN